METLITGGNGLRDGVVLTAAWYLRHARPGVQHRNSREGRRRRHPRPAAQPRGVQS